MECLICFEIKNNIIICPNEKCNKSVCMDCGRKKNNKNCYYCRIETFDNIIENRPCMNCNEFKPIMKIIENNENLIMCFNCFSKYKECNDCGKYKNQYEFKINIDVMIVMNFILQTH